MPSEYDSGYNAGFRAGLTFAGTFEPQIDIEAISNIANKKLKSKKKLSAWQKFVKANASKPRFRYKSGAKKGKVNLKALGVAYRKTPAGKKSKKR